MKPSDFQKTIQCQFECKLKKVTKGIVRNYQKELKRRKNKEIPFWETTGTGTVAQSVSLLARYVSPVKSLKVQEKSFQAFFVFIRMQ